MKYQLDQDEIIEAVLAWLTNQGHVQPGNYASVSLLLKTEDGYRITGLEVELGDRKTGS